MSDAVSWDEYYLEVDRELRKELLDAKIAAEGMTPENQLRTRLWEVRYKQRGKDPAEVDYYIRGWLSMHYLQHATGGFFGRRNHDKEKQQILEDWGVSIAAEYGEAGQEILYQELCNMTRLYLNLCKDDKSYSSLLLGLGRMKDSSLINKIAKDVYTLAYEIPRTAGMVEEFQVFTRAATDTFYAIYPKNKAVLHSLIEEGARG